MITKQNNKAHGILVIGVPLILKKKLDLRG
jgi:hypothetical protein